MTATVRAQTRQAITALPLIGLCIVYLGLLAGDQTLPVLSSEDGFPQARHLALLAGLVLLPGVLAAPARRETGSAPRFITGLILFLTYIASTSLWSPTGADPENVMADFAVMCGFVLIGALCALRLDASAWQLFWVVVIGVSLVFALAGFADGGLGSTRMSAFGGGPNVFVRIVGVGAVVGAFLAFRSGRMTWFGATALLVSAAVLSGSRGGMLALSAALVVAALVGIRWLIERRQVAVFVIGISVTTLAAFAVLGDALEEVLFSRFGEQLIDQGQTAGRGELYEAGLEIWAESMAVGNGIGSFATLHGGGFTYTHNIVLDVLVDGGVLGLLLFLAALVAPGLRVWSTSHGVDSPLAATLALLILVASQFSGTYYDTRFLWFFLGLACIAAAPWRPLGTEVLGPQRKGDRMT